MQGTKVHKEKHGIANHFVGLSIFVTWRSTHYFVLLCAPVCLCVFAVIFSLRQLLQLIQPIQRVQRRQRVDVQPAQRLHGRVHLGEQRDLQGRRLAARLATPTSKRRRGPAAPLRSRSIRISSARCHDGLRQPGHARHVHAVRTVGLAGDDAAQKDHILAASPLSSTATL